MRAIDRRYFALLALRFVPTGLAMTVIVLLLQERGLSLAQIGVGIAAQGLVMLFLELPTGGLADAVGRKPVAVLAAVFALAATGLLLVTDTVAMLAAAFALQGVFRALDSGPLQAWYVDRALAADPGADVVRLLGRAEVVVCCALGAGALGGALVVGLGGLPGVGPLASPVVLALAVQAAAVVAVVRLVDEPPRTDGTGWRAARAATAEVPAVVRDAVAAMRRSRLLAALVAAEFLWGFGMISFETLLPARMDELAGGPDRAAAILGPALTAAWAASALGSAVAPRLARRFGPGPTGSALRVAHGLTVTAMAIALGPAGLVAAYLATYLVHGTTNAVHYGMVHSAADSGRRATILSANSLAAQAGGALSGIALGALADATTVPIAMLAGAAALAAAAPLYFVRHHRAEPAPSAWLVHDQV